MLGEVKMMSHPAHRPQRALTLVELMIAIAVLGVILTLAAPSFRDIILMQRLKGVNAQLVTDLQFARSEAAARGLPVRVRFQADTNTTCYTIYTSASNSNCNCLVGAGAACTGSMVEIRTVQVARSTGVAMTVRLAASGNQSGFAYDHITGGILSLPSDFEDPPIETLSVDTAIDDARVLRTEVGKAGRVTVCAPASVSVGAQPC